MNEARLIPENFDASSDADVEVEVSSHEAKLSPEEIAAIMADDATRKQNAMRTVMPRWMKNITDHPKDFLPKEPSAQPVVPRFSIPSSVPDHLRKLIEGYKDPSNDNLKDSSHG